MWDAAVIFIVLSIVGYILKKLRSREPNKIKFNFNFFIFYFLGSCLAFVIWPLFLLKPKSVRNAATGARILKHITKIYDLKWELRNGEILAADRGAVIVSNHQSSLDVLGMFNIWEVVNKMSVIAKKEVFYVWPFGLAAYLAGVVFIDRNNAKCAYEQLKITSEVMTKNKIHFTPLNALSARYSCISNAVLVKNVIYQTKIWLFPEGTRNKDYTKLLSFKKGAFTMAVTAQVPIIPVVFSPYYFINAKKNIFNRGHVVIQCLEEIPTIGLSRDDVPQLMERVRNLMERKYRELSKEVINDLPSDYPHTTVG